MEYTFTELCWLFLIYSFIGWVIEAAVGTIKNRRFTNRGFSTGPFCIVYGIAAAEDCGGDIKGDRMDLYMPTFEECMQFGRRRCTIYFLG